jgi:hypothetical protein
MGNIRPITPKESRHINGYTSSEAKGENSNPSGERGIRIPKDRKFATTPPEYVRLILECFKHELATKKLPPQNEKLVMRIAEMLITKDNYQDYINLSAKALYTQIELQILAQL